MGRVFSRDAREAIEASARLVDRVGGTTSVLRATRAVTRGARPALSDAAAAYQRVFGLSVRDGVCQYETEYGDDGVPQQPQALADLTGYYYFAFGLHPGIASDLRVDHVACECDFMEFLCRKEAGAIDRGRVASPHEDRAVWSAIEEDTRNVSRRFLRDHLARFGVAFSRRLEREDTGLCGRLGRLLARLLEAECSRLGVVPGPASLGLRPVPAGQSPGSRMTTRPVTRCGAERRGG